MTGAGYADCNGMYTLSNLTSIWDSKVQLAKVLEIVPWKTSLAQYFTNIFTTFSPLFYLFILFLFLSLFPFLFPFCFFSLISPPFFFSLNSFRNLQVKVRSMPVTPGYIGPHKYWIFYWNLILSRSHFLSNYLCQGSLIPIVFPALSFSILGS